jgi:hydroxymethylpyrimidine pyrophosphatase-like HAD family hydrolase
MLLVKKYKAIFFDWDGTAVVSRKASPDKVIAPMKALLQKGIPLIIISGTTYDKIAGGKLESYFTPAELKNLFLGLGRGAYNYRFNEEGQPVIWKNLVPPMPELLKIHEICFAIHQELLGKYGFQTDIVFSRPNYCKIDLMVESDRGEQLFLQNGELEALERVLEKYGIISGLHGLMSLSHEIAKERGMALCITSDAKFLEIGISDKSNNVNDILQMLMAERDITPEECAYWGDEYVGLGENLFGSDSFMITELSKGGDFFDVSETEGDRPENVTCLGNGVDTFREFLINQVG